MFAGFGGRGGSVPDRACRVAGVGERAEAERAATIEADSH
jgi:hypothetical protein